MSDLQIFSTVTKILIYLNINFSDGTNTCVDNTDTSRYLFVTFKIVPIDPISNFKILIMDEF